MMNATDWFARESAFPPSLDGKPLMVWLIVMGLWAGTLLSLQLFYAQVAAVRDDHRKWGHPLTSLRAFKALCALGSISLAMPRLILVSGWSLMTPVQRRMWALESWQVYIIWAIIVTFAWWIDRVSHEAVEHQLHRVPTMQVTPGFFRRNSSGIKIFVVILSISFVTTFVRPQHHVPFHAAASKR